MPEKRIKYSIIIPVFNEGKAIQKVVLALSDFLERNLSAGEFEIIIVDDGSTDQSNEIVSFIKGVRSFRHPYNKGYGSALKLGAKKAKGEFLIFYDGDGQHEPEEMIKLIQAKESFDMVVGARRGYQGPPLRQPGKKIINLLASYLVSFKIPDLNSGLRLVRRKCFKKFAHLYPKGFSLSTTLTLVLIKEGYSIKYVPIKIGKREGKSTLKLRDGFNALNLVIRMIMLFSPLRIFVPIGSFFLAGGLVSLARDLFIVSNINDNTVLFLISSLIFFFFGLIADQIASLRREAGK